MSIIKPPTPTYGWPTLDFKDIEKPIEYCEALERVPVLYKLGGKVMPLGRDDLRSIQFLDCSGFTRDALFRSTGKQEGFPIPDGSVNQHEWCNAMKFKTSTVQDAMECDGRWRWAFLTPEQGGGIGHTLLIYNGWTWESFGHHGPGSRKWPLAPFMRRMEIYVIS